MQILPSLSGQSCVQCMGLYSSFIAQLVMTVVRSFFFFIRWHLASQWHISEKLFEVGWRESQTNIAFYPRTELLSSPGIFS